MSRTAASGQQARTQGVFQTVQFAIQILGALAGGALFTISPALAFLAMSAVCLLGIGTAALTGRLQLLPVSTARVRGSASHTTPPPGSPNQM